MRLSKTLWFAPTLFLVTSCVCPHRMGCARCHARHERAVDRPVDSASVKHLIGYAHPLIALRIAGRHDRFGNAGRKPATINCKELTL